jgi:hypothetical protein
LIIKRRAEPRFGEKPMDSATAINELEELAKKLDVEIRYDRFTGEGTRTGGLCKIRGKWRVIIEKRASPSEKISVLARCLARFDTEQHFLSPPVRQLVERSRSEIGEAAKSASAKSKAETEASEKNESSARREAESEAKTADAAENEQARWHGDRTVPGR